MPTSTLARDLGVSPDHLAQLYAEIERHLAQHAPARPFGLPSTDALIRQAGIRRGPAPRTRRRPFARRRPAATVAEHLLAAADLIDTYGWTQGALRRGPAMCILGAQQVLVALGHTSPATATAAAQALTRHLGGGINYWEWQDSRYRDRQQVLDLLRNTAAEVR